MTKKMKNLKFTCPDCGKHRLECVMDGINTCEVTSLHNSGDFDYGPVESESDVVRWQCLECGYTLKDGDGEDIIDNVEVANWIEENCK